jgi:hypothetical protein
MEQGNLVRFDRLSIKPPGGQAYLDKFNLDRWQYAIVKFVDLNNDWVQLEMEGGQTISLSYPAATHLFEVVK